MSKEQEQPKEEPYILVRGCRCSVVGQQDRKDICHHKDKPCHTCVSENEFCSPPQPNEQWEESFNMWLKNNGTFLGGISSNIIPDLKSFISQQLASARSQERKYIQENMYQVASGLDDTNSRIALKVFADNLNTEQT